jgi:hypothetical protein
MISRWVGIDEAGYGPNLGPLVMAAAMAEGPGEREPDVWADLAATVARAGTRDGRLWVDDSKRIYRGGNGLDRLDAAALAALDAAGLPAPTTLGAMLDALGCGGLIGAELDPWLDPGFDPVVPHPASRERVEQSRTLRPFDGAPWRLVALHAVVVGPARFNAAIARSASGSKAEAHAEAFGHLMGVLWDAAAGAPTAVRADKHGGRHFYHDLLVRTLPDAWIDRGPEGPALSRYVARGDGRRLAIDLCPKADAGDGLVALASIVAKAVREHWMAAFNAHWLALVPGLRPTAGYPADAARFRAAIGPHCRARGLDESRWWRRK